MFPPIAAKDADKAVARHRHGAVVGIVNGNGGPVGGRQKVITLGHVEGGIYSIAGMTFERGGRRPNAAYTSTNKQNLV